MKAIAGLSTLVGAVAMARAVASTSTARAELSTLGVLLGGLAVGLSPPFLDGIMHPDLRPFMPWSDNNPFLGLIGVVQLHFACITAALFGAGCVTPWKIHNAQRAG